jgi:hypothetical protein
MLWSARRNPTRYLVPRERLKELYKESRAGAPDGPVRKSQTATDYHAGPTDKRASLRGEYENFLIPQTERISVCVCEFKSKINWRTQIRERERVVVLCKVCAVRDRE